MNNSIIIIVIKWMITLYHHAKTLIRFLVQVQVHYSTRESLLFDLTRTHDNLGFFPKLFQLTKLTILKIRSLGSMQVRKNIKLM